MMKNDLDLLQVFQTQKDVVLDLLTEALRNAGLHDVEIKAIHLEATRRAPVCPSGHPCVWEPVPQKDGSIVYQYVCK